MEQKIVRWGTWTSRSAIAMTFLGAGLVGCGGGGGSGSGSGSSGGASGGTGGTSPTYIVGGSVSGLSAGSVVLTDNGADALTVPANGAFTFAGKLAAGSAYAVAVATSPTGLTCTVENGSGTVPTTNVSNVAVACTPTVTAQAALVFRSSSDTVNTGVASGVISLQAVDAAGNVVGPTTPVVLTSSSPTMQFSATPDFASPVTSVSLVTDHATFYFRDSTAGSPSITAATPGYADGTLTETVVPAITDKGTVNMVASGVASNQPLIQTSDGTLYGVADGLSVNFIYSVDTLGVLTKLHTFGSDADYPTSGLTLALDGNFYGTTQLGTAGPNGAIYRLTPAGAFSVVHAFIGNAGGGNPVGGLTVGSDGRIYGTTYFGGTSSNDCGTVFAMTVDGQFTTLHVFTGQTDGCEPEGGVIQASDDLFYGTTELGGTPGYGTVFAMTAAGQTSTVHAFVASEGRGPTGRLLEARDGRLYGATTGSGPTSTSRGSVFSVSKAGDFKVLYGFASSAQGTQDGYLSETYRSMGTLIQLADGSFYGTTAYGGVYGAGTVFQISPAGSEVLVHSFQNSTLLPGSSPVASLLLGIDGNLYGTAGSGGPAGAGTIFSMSGFF